MRGFDSHPCLQEIANIHIISGEFGLTTPCLNDHYFGSALSVQWRSTLSIEPKQLTKTINDWGSVLEAVQRVALQLLGMIALIYLVVQAIWR